MRPVGAESEDVRTNLDGVKIASALGILPIWHSEDVSTSSRMHAYESLIFKPADTSRMSDETMLSVRIPRELVACIDEIVDRQILGFGSRVEFVADAIRRRLEHLIQLGLAGPPG